jgi:hypothetical protein
MFKCILSAALLVATSVAIADTNTATVTASVTASATKTLPVIIKNEPLDTKICRLHFEDGTQKDVSCEMTTEKAS